MTMAPQRAPQQERSRRTRARLLEAAVDQLAENGLEGFATPTIAMRAGVSKGALFQHFPSREALLVAAMDQIFAGHREQLRQREKRLRAVARGGRVEAYLRTVLELMCKPEYLGALQVQAAARTNQSLASAIRSHAIEQIELAAAFGESVLVWAGAPARPDLRALTRVALYTLEGAASHQALSGDREASGDVVKMLSELITPLLTEDAG